MVYKLKLRVMVCRAARCLRLCDRFLSPRLVMLANLLIRANKMSHICHYSLRAEVEINSMESRKMSKTL